ncbi:MAG: DUF4199 domain-containing protein [Bacteroidia bacterium]|nr:DUF4199 domain-containing protein [Bacteroidia bacterium]
MKKFTIEIKWALYFTLMTLVWMLLENLSGLHGKYIDYHLYLTNLFVIPAIWFLVLALKDKKKIDFNGEMSYKQGLIFGIILSLFIAILSPLTQWIISYVITPEYFPNVIKRSVELGYFKTTEEAEANFNYKTYAINSTIFGFVFGVFTSAIAMIFIRTKTK